MNWYKIAKNEVSSDFSTRFKNGIPPSLNGLAAEARKCSTFEDFERDYVSEIKHGMYWHITEDPNFQIDPQKGPRDMSSLAVGNSMSKGALMITSHLEYWEGYGNRKYAALIDMSDVPKGLYKQVHRGFGNEFFISDASKAKVIAVMPLNEALALSEKNHELVPQNAEELYEFYLKANNLEKTA